MFFVEAPMDLRIPRPAPVVEPITVVANGGVGGEDPSDATF